MLLPGGAVAPQLFGCGRRSARGALGAGAVSQSPGRHQQRRGPAHSRARNSSVAIPDSDSVRWERCQDFIASGPLELAANCAGIERRSSTCTEAIPYGWLDWHISILRSALPGPDEHLYACRISHSLTATGSERPERTSVPGPQRDAPRRHAPHGGRGALVGAIASPDVEAASRWMKAKLSITRDTCRARRRGTPLACDTPSRGGPSRHWTAVQTVAPGPGRPRGPSTPGRLLGETARLHPDRLGRADALVARQVAPPPVPQADGWLRSARDARD